MPFPLLIPVASFITKKVFCKIVATTIVSSISSDAYRKLKDITNDDKRKR